MRRALQLVQLLTVLALTTTSSAEVFCLNPPPGVPLPCGARISAVQTVTGTLTLHCSNATCSPTDWDCVLENQSCQYSQLQCDDQGSGANRSVLAKDTVQLTVTLNQVCDYSECECAPQDGLPTIMDVLVYNCGLESCEE